jgi:hypothetical protein
MKHVRMTVLALVCALTGCGAVEEEPVEEAEEALSGDLCTDACLAAYGTFFRFCQNFTSGKNYIICKQAASEGLAECARRSP